jgi:NAD(P)-dependent dehydrogenase (short-subunit alcohol dehydrogenase family)
VGVADVISGALELSWVPAVQDEGGSVGGKAVRKRAAQAVGGAGDLAPTGSITLLGAITARAAMPGTAGIAAINGAVEALVKPLAAELAPIRVNGVSPGLVDTPWWNGLPDDARQAYFTHAAQALPARRIATADAVILAATNPNLTGTIIETGGGARLSMN